MYQVHFEITNQRGNMFSHVEESRIAGLARVRVHEKKDERFTDWSGTVRRFVAKSQKPFSVTILSYHTSDGEDLSRIMVLLASSEVAVG